MVDYLMSYKERSKRESSSTLSMSSLPNSSLGRCLDLGCGTGVVGLAALLQGAERCIFSDKSVTPWYLILFPSIIYIKFISFHFN